MTLSPLLQHLYSDFTGIQAQVLKAVITADWLPLVAAWGLGLCAVESIEHLEPLSSETRHPV
jgi:hypothetical protein